MLITLGCSRWWVWATGFNSGRDDDDGLLGGGGKSMGEDGGLGRSGGCAKGNVGWVVVMGLLWVGK